MKVMKESNISWASLLKKTSLPTWCLKPAALTNNTSVRWSISYSIWCFSSAHLSPESSSALWDTTCCHTWHKHGPRKLTWFRCRLCQCLFNAQYTQHCACFCVCVFVCIHNEVRNNVWYPDSCAALIKAAINQASSVLPLWSGNSMWERLPLISMNSSWFPFPTASPEKKHPRTEIHLHTMSRDLLFPSSSSSSSSSFFKHTPGEWLSDSESSPRPEISLTHNRIYSHIINSA